MKLFMAVTILQG